MNTFSFGIKLVPGMPFIFPQVEHFITFAAFVHVCFFLQNQQITTFFYTYNINKFAIYPISHMRLGCYCQCTIRIFNYKVGLIIDY